jgi:hypothetical protein
MRDSGDKEIVRSGARTRSRLTLPLFVVLASVYVAWLGFHVQTMGDYPVDYGPAMNALLGGHIAAFFNQLPTNGAGGSLLLRLPGALLGNLLIGSQHAVFRFGALECMLVVGGLGLLLARRSERQGYPAVGAVGLVVLLTLVPGILDAVRFGHPEEPLGAALCVIAVLVARDHPWGAGVALGLAVLNKPWGVLAIAPTLLAAGRGGRLKIAVLSASIFGGWALAAYFASPGHFSRIVIGASTSVVAHPVDLWWPLAHFHVAPGVSPAYFPPKLISDHARELAVLLSIPLSVPLLRKPDRSLIECMALLSLLFLVRCALDPSNHVYYQVPLIVALASYEAVGRGKPVLALAATLGFYAVFHTISGVASLDVQFAAYIAVALPLALALAGPATGRRSPMDLPWRVREVSIA